MRNAAESRIVITGASGFLAWHLRLNLEARGYNNVTAIDRTSWDTLSELGPVDVVFHLAGVNRSTLEEELELENIRLARQLSEGLIDHPPATVVYANSVHSTVDNPYGRGKKAAGAVLGEWMNRTGGRLVDVRLPNLFGEHGRPFYNSFVATFIDLAVQGKLPEIQDREIPLLHAQEAADVLVNSLTSSESVLRPVGHPVSVADVWAVIARQHEAYSTGIVPDLGTKLELQLFNTLRAKMFLLRPSIELTQHIDSRGRFVESARSLGGQGQMSFSTTAQGVTRGNHFHLRKIERFVVVSGQALIRLRRVHGADSEGFDIPVDGAEPVAVDMPIGWAHNITNTGSGQLLTQFWVNEVYNPSDPDTIAWTIS